MLDRAPAVPAVPEAALAVLPRLKADLRSNGPLDWNTTERDFTELIEALGS